MGGRGQSDVADWPSPVTVLLALFASKDRIVDRDAKGGEETDDGTRWKKRKGDSQILEVHEAFVKVDDGASFAEERCWEDDAKGVCIDNMGVELHLCVSQFEL